MKIDSATSEFKIHRVITQFTANDVILTLTDENGSTALKIEMSHAETSLIEHELAHMLIILKMQSRLTDAEMQQYRRVVNEEGIRILGESKGENDD